ncbi:MAG: Eco57I restriction-modification methylase domain-containing protein [Steroidobacteraceae bacterium]
MHSLMPELDARRLAATKHLDQRHRSAFGQFFTPSPVASFMASLIKLPKLSRPLSILDPGAGIGLLSAALLERLQGEGKVTAYELEPSFHAGLRQTLAGFKGSHDILCQDFIEAAVITVATGKATNGLFDVAILNPPYKKIQTDSHHRALMRKIGVETSNLYTCFVACAVALCKPGAQVVAIIPRSWMNGPYFKPFRYWLFEHAALTHIHMFDSRDKAFADDEVLQENVIIRLAVGSEQGEVEVSVSHDQKFADVRHRIVPFSEVVTPGDRELFVHVPTLGSPSTEGLPGKPLREIGLDICTGPVVDFRLKDHLRMEPVAGSAPLLYSTHFANGRFEWPRQTRKPNAIMINAASNQWLMPNGCYVVLRRFTSKEEKRRVVAYLLDEGVLPCEWIGFENHLNVIHQDKHGMEPSVARGMAAYLNSQAVDDYFRTFSGHTQVNATDLRRMKYPSIEELKKLGERQVNAQKS